MTDKTAKPAANRILLVEDNAALGRMYESALTDEGYDVKTVSTGGGALEFLETQPAALMLLDLKLPDMDGLAVLESLQKHHPHLPVIIITGHGSMNTAVAALRAGARDFLVKPFDIERLTNAVKSELGAAPPQGTMPADLAGNPPRPQDAAPAPLTVVRDIQNRPEFGGFVGTSGIMQKIYEQIEAAAGSDATVFITGQSGTGKEICAEAIHKHSPRAGRPFVPLNCAAIPRDLMESELFGHVKGAFTGAIADREGAARLADGGTLFLDEIAEMAPEMQTKLLRFLQDFRFRKIGGSRLEKTDVRIICATNKNPLEEIRAGRFREDLFYRLHVLPLYMPPLSARGDDIIDIAQIFLQRFTAGEGKSFTGFSAEAEYMLRRYNWPGNIRQLQNVIRNIAVMHDGETVTPDMLPAGLLHGDIESTATDTEETIPAPSPVYNFTAPRPADIRPLAEAERDIIESAIAACGGNIPKAAAALDVSPSTIYRKKTAWEEEEAQNGVNDHGDGKEDNKNPSLSSVAGG